MIITHNKIGFGGGCHWCTEAVFQSLNGVHKIEQGWVGSEAEHSSLSEAITLEYDPKLISLEVLVEVHLRTHSSSSEHSMRGKYRSAVYVFCETQKTQVKESLRRFQENWPAKLVTQVLMFVEFKSNHAYQGYYYSKPDKPFCQRHIDPKLQGLLKQFPMHANHAKITTALSNK